MTYIVGLLSHIRNEEYRTYYLRLAPPSEDRPINFSCGQNFYGRTIPWPNKCPNYYCGPTLIDSGPTFSKIIFYFSQCFIFFLFVLKAILKYYVIALKATFSFIQLFIYLKQ